MKEAGQENKSLAATSLEAAIEKERPAIMRTQNKINNRARIKSVAGELSIEGEQALAYSVLMDTLKTASCQSAHMRVSAAASAKPFGGNRDKNNEYAIEVLRDLDPQTPLEGMLVSQMIAVDSAAAQCLDKAMDWHKATLESVQQWVNLATKLQRTFLQQIEALQKLRGAANQIVQVEHVHVHSGGQAIVGHVEHGVTEGCSEK